MKDCTLKKIETGVKMFGRTWDKVESYTIDEYDWKVIEFEQNEILYEIYENNNWGGLILYVLDKTFISYI